jgi:site-specific recombinase XerD
MNIQDAVEKYLADVGAHRSPATHANYTYALAAFVSYVGRSLECGDLTHKHLSGFIADVLKRGYAPSTAGVYSTAVSGFVKYAIRHDWVSWSPASILKVEDGLSSLRQRRGKKLPRIPSPDDVQAVIAMAYESPLPSPTKERNIVLVELLRCTGCRIHEVASLKVGDIDLKAREAIVSGKGKKERKVFLSPIAVNTCQQYWKIRCDASPTSPVLARHDDGAGKKTRPIGTAGLRRVVDQLAMLAGVKNFTPHKFRHAFATRLLEETSDLAMVQDALGHSSPETTRVYAQVNPQSLKRAHREVFG